jgi:hypothetical protein
MFFLLDTENGEIKGKEIGRAFRMNGGKQECVHEI